MNIRVPIYVEEREPEAAVVQHVRPVSLRPLFFPQPVEQDVSLQRATARLTNELRSELGRLARFARHEELAAYSFYPPLDETMLEFTVEVAKKRFPLRHLFVVLSAFGRRFAWTPSVPEVWVEISRGETRSRQSPGSSSLNTIVCRSDAMEVKSFGPMQAPFMGRHG